MAAALIHPIGGGQFSASASKSGLCLSPGLLAVGGVRAAFQEWRPGEPQLPTAPFVPPEHSGQHAAWAPTSAQWEGPPSGSGQVSGILAAMSSKRLGLEFLILKRLCLQG